MEMATLSSILGAAALASSTAISIAQNKQNTKAAQKAAEAQSERLATQAQAQEEERINLLKKQIAANIARFSASGLDSGDTGSNAAVLQGLENEAKEDIAKIRSGYLFDLEELENSLAKTQQKNLLSSASSISSSIGQASTKL